MTYIGCEVLCIKNVGRFVAGETYLLEHIGPDDMTLYCPHNDTVWSFTLNKVNDFFDLSKVNKLKAFW